MAIFGTPRSGNTWFPALLKTTFDLTDFAMLDPERIPWDSLPPRVVVNLHATPDDTMRERLRRLGLRPIVIARHPLDALISILHFAEDHPNTNGWLLGRGGSEDPIRGAAPTSPEFFDYATGPRTAALLSISRLWWDEPGVIRARYEDLVADAGRELERIAAELGATPARPIADVVAEHQIDVLRVRQRAYQAHMWKGQPGLWRQLMPARLARAIAAAHPEAFTRPENPCDPDDSLTEAQAAANWNGTLAEANQRDIGRLWDLIEAMRTAADESRRQVADLSDRLSRALAGLDEQQARLVRADEIIRETNIRADELIRETNLRADALIRETNVRADELIREAERRAADAESHRAALSGQLNDARAKITELTGRLARSEAQAGETLDDPLAAQPIDATTLAVARRLSVLAARFPRAARIVSGLRRAG